MKRSSTCALALATATAFAGTTAHAAWIVGLGADGGSIHTVDPNTPSSLTSFVGQYYTGQNDGSLFAGVVAHDVDATNPGDELIFSRQLDNETGTRGLFVHRVQPNGSESERLGFNSRSYALASMTRGQFLDGGTRTGIAAFRYDKNNNRPFVEIWDPQDIMAGNDRTSFQSGGTGADWLRSTIGAGEVFSSGTGDEFIVIRADPSNGNPTSRFEVYGLTSGTVDTDNVYTRLSTQTVSAGQTAAAVTIANGAGPNGEGIAVVLRGDGRITFWDMVEAGEAGSDGIDDSTRLGYTTANAAWANFIQVVDVLDSNAGDEIIVGLNEAGGGVQGLGIYAMPDLTTQSGDLGDLGVLSPLYTLDVDQELQGFDVISSVPEPATAALLGLGGLALFGRTRR